MPPLNPDEEAVLDYLKHGTEKSAGSPSGQITPAEAARILGADNIRVRRPITSFERRFLPPNRPYTGLDVKDARQWARAWDDFGFTGEEVRSWLRAGIDPDESSLAALLVEEGIDPWRWAEELVHPDTGERLSILEVVRREAVEVQRQGALGLCRALDAAGVERARRQPVLPRWLRRRGTAS